MRSMFLVFVCVILIVAILTCTCAQAQPVDFSRETIYFIVVDRFRDGNPDNNPKGEIYSPDRSEWKLYWGGDLQGIIDKLPYVKKLGCTAIWITPIFENTDKLYLYGKNKEEKISSYHGYWGSDFYRINPYFGDEEKFRELIEKAHEMDIKIIFDMVLNHSNPVGQGIDGAIYKNGKFIADYSNDPDNWFHHHGSIDFSKKDPSEWQNKNLYDLADFNTENPRVEEYLFGAALKWMSMGIDAFRLDTVRHVPVDFCKRFERKMKEENPDVFIFGEWSMGGVASPAAVEFTRITRINLIDFQFTYTLSDVLCRGKSFKNMHYYIQHDKKIRNPQLMVTCIDNHDMPRFISTAIDNGASMETARKLTRLATYIMMTSRGIPCIYYGTEQYLHVGKQSTWGFGGEPYNRQMMTNWDNYNDFCKNIKKLADLRRVIPAVSRGNQETLYVSDNAWVYQRKFADSVLVAAVNRGPMRKFAIDQVHLPDGRYDNSDYRFYRVMGPSITINQMKTEFILGENEMGIWCNRN